MSAFVVDDITINRVVSWMNVKAMGSRDTWFHVLRPFVEMGYKLETEIGCKRLGEEMFTVNCESIEQRYGEGEAKEFRDLDYQYKFGGFSETGDIHQVLKSLRCWIYQSCEGNVPETSALYKAMDRLSRDIPSVLVQSSPQYDEAHWG